MANQNLVNKMTSEERVALMKAVLQNIHIRESQMRAPMEDVSKSLLLGRVLLEESAIFRDSLSNDSAKNYFILTGDMLASNPPMLGSTASDFIKTMESIIKTK